MSEAVMQDQATPPPREDPVSPRWPGGAQTVRVNWSMKKSAKTVAEQAGDGEGYSQASYVSAMIEQRHAGWTAALDFLLFDEEWTKKRVREALVKLPQPQPFPKRPARVVNDALGLKGDDRLADTVARALLTLALESVAGNAELDRRLS